MKKYKRDPASIRVMPAGWAADFLPGFMGTLSSLGHTELTVRDYGRAASHFGAWAAAHGVKVAAVTDRTVSSFAAHRCCCATSRLHGRRVSKRYVARVRRFVNYLRMLGVVPAALAAPSPALPPWMEEFRQWLTVQRGLAASTIRRYENMVGQLLRHLGDDPRKYDAGLVRTAILTEVADRHPVYAKSYVCALRSWLKFLAAQGACQPWLERAVPTLPVWKLTALPRYLGKRDLKRVIQTCDLSTELGIRDRAILLLLSRLGLRAGDIVGMLLDDIDWANGTVRVSGKSRQEVCLPLPQDTGDAVLKYITSARPTAGTRRLFLCIQAPVRPFSNSSTVSAVVARALRNAGIDDPPSRGAHLMRHSAATSMLRDGMSLDAIAVILRHKSTDTTAYYAKVDTTTLELVAMPWPEVRHAER